MIDMGVGTTDVSISMESLYAENRKIVDPIANRYFFVWDPMELEITNLEPTVAKLPLHPTDHARGMRKICVRNKVFVCREDVEKLKVGSVLRLKDFCNIEITSLVPFQAKHSAVSLEDHKKSKGKIIHWVPIDGISVKVRGPYGDIEGTGERGIATELDKIVQFERFGFCRVDTVEKEKVVVYFAHK
jgi:glutamyl-tRNA synthetase